MCMPRLAQSTLLKSAEFDISDCSISWCYSLGEHICLCGCIFEKALSMALQVWYSKVIWNPLNHPKAVSRVAALAMPCADEVWASILGNGTAPHANRPGKNFAFLSIAATDHQEISASQHGRVLQSVGHLLSRSFTTRSHQALWNLFAISSSLFSACRASPVGTWRETGQAWRALPALLNVMNARNLLQTLFVLMPAWQAG